MAWQPARTPWRRGYLLCSARGEACDPADIRGSACTRSRQCAERKSIRVTEFQRRQLSAIKKELDQEYELVSTANLQRLQSTPNYLAAHRLDLGTGNIAQLG
jgi:hypothetical protein